MKKVITYGTNGYKYTAGEAIVMADKIERYMGE